MSADWETALLGEPYARGLCSVLDCGQPATYTDLDWAASGHEPYRCAFHADSDVHTRAAPDVESVRALGWGWADLTVMILPACHLTPESAYWAALMRDAYLTPDEARVRARVNMDRFYERVTS